VIPAAGDPTAVRTDVTIGFAITVGRTTVEALDDVKRMLEELEEIVKAAGGVLIVREVALG
jgi:hypothetical protein